VISARVFASVVVDSEDNHRLYVFGGRNIHHFYFSDLYEIDLEYKSSQCALVEDIRSLLNDSNWFDVIFVFPQEENKQIRAHRNILASRSSHFTAMFKSGMKEAIQGIVLVHDVKYSTFYGLLEYLYSGRLYVPSGEVIDLLQVADKYGLEHLKQLCAKKIQRFIDRHNVVELLTLAEKFKQSTAWGTANYGSTGSLRESCLYFIAKHHASLSHQGAFRSLPPSLLNDIAIALKQYR